MLDHEYIVYNCVANISAVHPRNFNIRLSGLMVFKKLKPAFCSITSQVPTLTATVMTI